MAMTFRALAFAAALFVAAPTPAEDGFFAPQAASASQPAASQAELDRLLAPIALYPDELLAQVLAASTYPLEVVALDRWLKAHPGLSGDALQAAVDAQPWDDSVKALAPMPDIVAMMDGELEWTQRLGDAFLAAEADVMDAVQRLRRHARDAGSLQDSARDRIVDDGNAIDIEPVEPDVVYVPVYDPRGVYGPWWWPDSAPYVWGGAYFGPWDFIVGGIGFGAGVFVGARWHEHPRFDWGGRHLVNRRPGSPPAWQHDPGHRGGVPYVNPLSRERFHPVDGDRIRDRGDFRGFGPRPPSPANPAERPARTNRATNPIARPANPIARPTGPSPLTPVPRAQSQEHSQRGSQSLGRAQSASPASRGRGKP